MNADSSTFISQLFLPFTSPVTQHAPCGPALEYASEYLELERLLQGTPEQQYGNTVIPGEEPDWRNILQRSVDLLAKTRDLRLAVIATRASIECHGLAALPAGLEFIVSLLENHWESVHPELEEGDSTFRQNALAGLNDHSFLLKTLRNTAILESRGISDIRVSNLEKLHQGGAVPNLTSRDLLLHLRNQPGQTTRLIRTIQDSLAACQRIDTVLAEHTQTARFSEDLQRVLDLVQSFLPTPQSPEDNLRDDTSLPHSANATSSERPVTSQAICSRNDISLLINQMCDYLETHEPGHPAPLLLRRAQKLLGMDFLSIMRDLNPDSIRSIEQLAGITQN